MFFKFKEIQDDSKNENVRVKILGTGCKKCAKLEANAILALKKLVLMKK